MKAHRLVGWLWAAAVAAALTLMAASLWFGDLNQDEGWYLYGARLVSEGQWPYVDFAHTQGPVLPVAYSLAWPLVAHAGVAGGRLVTAALGLATGLLVAWLVARLAPPSRRAALGLVAFSLAAVNVYQCYFLTIVKTYALTTFLLMLGLVALSRAWSRGGRGAALLAGVLLGLAGLTRTSAGAVVPAAMAVLWWAGRAARRGPAGGPAARPADAALWRWLGAGALLAGAVALGPFLLLAPRAVWFALVEFHVGRQSGGLVSALAYKAGFAVRQAQAYLAAFGLAAAALLWRWLADGPRRDAGGAPAAAPAAPAVVEAVLWAGAAAITLVHGLAPFPYDDYQVVAYPLFAAALALALARITAAARPDCWLAVAVLALSLMAAAASPMTQSWFVGKRDRIWWPLKTVTPLEKLRETGRILRGMTRPGEAILTQDPYVAVEAGLTLPRGLELGPFSYFPGWSRQRAAACRVLNREMLRELIQGTEARVAAFSGYGLAIGLPDMAKLPEREQKELWKCVESRFRPLMEIDDFGQAETTLRILVREPGNPSPPQQP